MGRRIAGVTIDSGDFPLIRNVDHTHQPNRMDVWCKWLRIYTDELPRALEHLPEVIADIRDLGGAYSSNESRADLLRDLLGDLHLDEAARLLNELRAEIPTNGDSPVGTEDRLLRERVTAFALSDAADPWHQEKLNELYRHWRKCNRRHFECALITPVIRLAEPSAPTVLGQYGRVSSIGGAGEICIRPSLLRGTHPMWDEPPTEQQALDFSLDVLLHEMIHQWQQEVTSNPEKGYHGHGPDFRDKCNEIGAVLELPPVRNCKRRGKDAELPSCSEWPHCVRASGYAGTIRSDLFTHPL